MKYLITGATGHIGNDLVHLLLGKNYQVKILIRNPKDPSIADLDCEKVVGDITDYEVLDRFIEEDAIVIHSAGLIDLTEKLLDQMLKVNFEATQMITQICIKKHCKLIYLGSTDAINIKNGLITEPDGFPLDGLDNYYAITKAMASDYVYKALKQGLLKGTIICPSCVLGRNDVKGSTQGLAIKRQSAKKVGFNMRGHYNFVDVECVSDGILKASLKEDLKPVYLFTGVDVSVKELYLSMFRVTDKKPHFIYVPLFLAYVGAFLAIPYYKIIRHKPILTKMMLDTISLNVTFDNQLATKELDLLPTDLDQLIAKTINWFKETR